MSTPERSEFPPSQPTLQSAASTFSGQQYFQEEPAPPGMQLQSQASEEPPSQEDNTVEPTSDDSQPQSHKISREEGQELSPSQAKTTSQPQQPIPDPPLPHSSDWDITEEEERLMLAALEDYESQAKRPKH